MEVERERESEREREIEKTVREPFGYLKLIHITHSFSVCENDEPGWP